MQGPTPGNGFKKFIGNMISENYNCFKSIYHSCIYRYFEIGNMYAYVRFCA